MPFAESALCTSVVARALLPAGPRLISALVQRCKTGVGKSADAAGTSARATAEVRGYDRGVASELWLIRHGETAWSLSGAHTGRTDLPLTPEGERKAAALGARLAGQRFALVLTSPLQRARRTCELAGFGACAQIEPNLLEWDYGDYEGRTTDQIHRERPDWSLFRDGVPGGETIGQVAARAQAAIERSLAADGNVALFAHGHILRILTACWLGMTPDAARSFYLGTAGISTLGYERETRVINSWNLQ